MECLGPAARLALNMSFRLPQNKKDNDALVGRAAAGSCTSLTAVALAAPSTHNPRHDVVTEVSWY